jgi:hypothetical protein
MRMRHAANRRREIARLQRLIERVHWPRLSMMLVVTLTAAAGFLASFALLHAGVNALWSRYLIAVAIAYLAFLFFLWCWLRLRRDGVPDGFDRRTTWPFVAVALSFSLAGGAMQIYAPDAKSIGQVSQHYKGTR